MWNADEKSYFEEVLGIVPPTFVQDVEASHYDADVVVLTESLDDVEARLLRKILASVQLFDLPIFSVLPANAKISHVLAFDGTDGVRGDATTSYWGFSEIGAMCGSSPAVNLLKRATWAQLKKFREVFRPSAR